MSAKRYGLYYAMAATVAAGTTAIAGTADAANTCTCLNSNTIRTYGPGSFVYKGSATAGYEAEIVGDLLYGFISAMSSASVPGAAAWFDWEPTLQYTTTRAWISKLSWTGVQVYSAPVAVRALTTDMSHQEIEVPTTGVTNPSNSVWDRYIMRVTSSSAISPASLPISLPKSSY